MNRLAQEPSPYLQQHAGNPVAWYPWCDEAFEKARAENKPIFLSIGYSSCHWCHVMEHESFSDNGVANLMNENFISIKVDREERPDIDSVYMKVCQILTGSGGWPLTIIMTPEKKPFYAATYLPKESLQGRMGMMDFLPKIAEIWKNKHNEITASAEQIIAALSDDLLPSEEHKLDRGSAEIAYRQLNRMFDLSNGGFGSSPKFPTAHHLIFLIRYWHRTKDKEALQMVEKTLRSMRQGGIYDHIGLGFHRYSTDSRWLVPHFEKMLYDQAMLMMSYSEAYAATQKSDYALVVREIADYLVKELKSPEGGFFSAEDADSENEEGIFYIWSYADIKSVLSEEDFRIAELVYDLQPDGNYIDMATGEKNGKNILHLKMSWPESSKRLGIAESHLWERLEAIRMKLYETRSFRVKPFKDKKILTDWNGLTIAALARASWVLNDDKILEHSRRAADFILDKLLRKDGRLFHRYYDSAENQLQTGNVAGIEGNLDDYAFMIWGLLELYQACYSIRYLKMAGELTDIMIDRFGDQTEKGFYFIADDAEIIINRQKELFDSAIPSGNSVALYNLFRMAHLTGDMKYRKMAEETLALFESAFQQTPSAFTFMLVGLEFGLNKIKEVVIIEKEHSPESSPMIKILKTNYHPNLVVHYISKIDDLRTIAPYINTTGNLDNKSIAYVCSDFSCGLPTENADTLIEMINGDPD